MGPATQNPSNLSNFAIFVHLGALGRSLCYLGALEPHLIAKMLQDGANMPQHSAKMSQHSLQEQPQDPKKPSKVMNCRRFFGFRHFW